MYWLQNSLFIADIISNMWLCNNFQYGKFELIIQEINWGGKFDLLDRQFYNKEQIIWRFLVYKTMLVVW